VAALHRRDRDREHLTFTYAFGFGFGFETNALRRRAASFPSPLSLFGILYSSSGSF
jgi:hypothetical protein